MISSVIELVKLIVGGITDSFKGKRDLKKAIIDNKIRLAKSEQEHNQDWELKQLDNAGYKDDILFYAFILVFVWAGFDPEGSKKFFDNISVLPSWFIKTWFWLIASVLGVKKIGDYLPSLFSGVRNTLKKKE